MFSLPVTVGSVWSPIDNLVSYTEVNNTTLSDAASLATALRDGTIKVIGAVDTASAGDYAITYSYTDSQANTITSVPVTIKVIGTKITAIDSTITAGSTWNPAANITAVTDAGGHLLTLDDVTAALADGSITYSITAPDGSSATSIDSTISGDYTVQYTYVDADKNSVSADPITITVKTSNTNSSGGNTDSNGSGQTTSPTTSNPAKPTTPNKPSGNKVGPSNPSKLATTVQRQTAPTAVSATTLSANTRDSHHIQALGLSTNSEADLVAAGSKKPAQRQHSSSLTFLNSAMSSAGNNGKAPAPSNSTTLPQTNDQPRNLLNVLGLTILAFLRFLGFRRKQD